VKDLRNLNIGTFLGCEKAIVFANMTFSNVAVVDLGIWRGIKRLSENMYIYQYCNGFHIMKLF